MKAGMEVTDVLDQEIDEWTKAKKYVKLIALYLYKYIKYGSCTIFYRTENERLVYSKYKEKFVHKSLIGFSVGAIGLFGSKKMCIMFVQNKWNDIYNINDMKQYGEQGKK